MADYLVYNCCLYRSVWRHIKNHAYTDIIRWGNCLFNHLENRLMVLFSQKINFQHLHDLSRIARFLSSSVIFIRTNYHRRVFVPLHPNIVHLHCLLQMKICQVTWRSHMNAKFTWSSMPNWQIQMIQKLVFKDPYLMKSTYTDHLMIALGSLIVWMRQMWGLLPYILPPISKILSRSPEGKSVICRYWFATRNNWNKVISPFAYLKKKNFWIEWIFSLIWLKLIHIYEYIYAPVVTIECFKDMFYHVVYFAMAGLGRRAYVYLHLIIVSSLSAEVIIENPAMYPNRKIIHVFL